MQIACLPGVMIHANTYVISSANSNSAVIVDPTRFDQLDSYLQQNQLVPKAVLLTHGHFDHTTALPAFLRKYPVPVYLHPGDTAMLTDPHCNALHIFFPDKPFDPIDSFESVSDGQSLVFDDLTFTVISTPGHSEGSVCYLIEDCLLSGDTLFKGSYGRYDLWGGDKHKLASSLRRLSLLDHEIQVYPGHGEATTIAQEYFKYKRF